MPRLPGPTASGSPRCGRPAGPVAKLAARCAAVVGQRDRTTPGEPPSLGGSEGNKNRRACSAIYSLLASFNFFKGSATCVLPCHRTRRIAGMNYCSCGTRTSKLDVFGEYEELTVLNKAAALDKLISQ